MKKIAILGSTGSIGQNSLKVIKSNPDKFKILALGANSQVELLSRQAREFKPEFIFVGQEMAAKVLKGRLPRGVKLLVGRQGIDCLCQDKSIDHILIAISGSAALYPLLKAIENKKEISLANKESLVMAGPIVMQQAQKNKVKIIPIDSEQSAIWQCLQAEDKKSIHKVYLTASGGPFRNLDIKYFKKITVDRALKHPRWKMGKKITVDSATLMNKGLEVLEAMYLFGLSVEQVEVVIHPESIIHSMVEFTDGVVMAQLSVADMRIPIQYALSYPQRAQCFFGRVDFLKLGNLSFFAPDLNKFACLRLAYETAREQGTMPAVMNAANEVSVEYFLNKKIDFVSIPVFVERVMKSHRNIKSPNIEEIFDADIWARRKTREIIGG